MARISTLLFLAIFVCISDTVKAGPIGYTLRNNMLARFDLDSPGNVTTVGTISGAVSFLTSIDFRPADGLLYGYDPVTTRIVTVNPMNAFTTFVSIPSIPSRNPFMGMDFNPVADRLRLVNTDNQNLRIDVSTGATIADGTLAYASGDPNFSRPLVIVDVAYTNSDTNPSTGTALYYLDGFGTLLTTSDPNAGTLNTVGSLGTGSISSFSSFDIVSDGIGGNTGYAILRRFGFYELRRIDLATDLATNLGQLGDGSTYRGLAIVQQAVPEPSSAVIALGLFVMSVRSSARRRRV